jgi:hypothetical protein
MRTFALSTVALGLLTTAAAAGPATPTGPSVLTYEQMDRVTAGRAILVGGAPPTAAGPSGFIVTPGAALFVEPSEPAGGGPAKFSNGRPGQGGSITTPGAPGQSVLPGSPATN